MIGDKKIKAILAITHSATLDEAVRKLDELTGKARENAAKEGTGDRAGASPGDGAELPGGEGRSKPVEVAMGEPTEAGGKMRDARAHAAVGEIQGADGVWLDVLAGQPPGLLGGLSAADVPMKSMDEQPMVGTDYLPPEEGPAPPRPDKIERETAAVLEAGRDRRTRPTFADVSAGPATGVQLTGGLDAVGPTFALERTYRDPALAYQAAVGDEWRRWRGAGLGRGVVDPKLAAAGLAAAGSSADRVWLDVMAGRPPGLLGGLAASEVPMKPAAGLGQPANETDRAILDELKKQSAHLEQIARNQAGGRPPKAQVPPAMPARPSGVAGRLLSGE